MNYPLSIIIVSYGNYDATTGPCLKSILEDPSNGPFEVVVVDNASPDDTPKRIKDIAALNNNVKLILNETNRGYAGGNNDGVAAAGGEAIVLLNSDTIVAPGSFENLYNIIKRNGAHAIIGPVTNEAGNEQKIFVTSRTPEGILEEGRKWCEQSKGDYFEAGRLDFFCVGMLRNTYLKLGGLDEGFGLGYYEDYDFSLGAKEQGMRTMVAEGVFVCHMANKTFSALGQDRIRRLMKKNKKILINKHSDKIKFYGVRDGNLRLMKEYVDLKKSAPPEDLQKWEYKFNNRLLLAKEIQPSSFINKYIYLMKLRNIEKRFYP